jgi:adenylate kinase
VETLRFGTLIYQSASRRHTGDLSYAQFRARAAELVTHADIIAATDTVLARKAALGDKWLIIDSHAVAQTGYGWQAHPDRPETLRLFDYDRIFHLHAPAVEIFKRSQARSDGRHLSDKSHAETLSLLQLSISAYYAGVVGCTLEVVDATGGVEGVVHVLAELLGL